MTKHSLLYILLLNFLIISCDSGLQGNLAENIAPNTSLTLNEINLPEGERLVSQVDISWWGDDPDGYIVGYEFLIGDTLTATDDDWTFTEKTDSTFILPIPEGNMDADVLFTIRAIDNDDARDTNPASLSFPIRNTRPNIQFNASETPPDTTYNIVSFGFTASDPDGNANLNRIEIALNDTSAEASWKEVPLDASLITLQINDTEGETTAEVLLGTSAVPSDITFNSVNLNSNNQLFVRSIDNAAAYSEVQSYSWYVKEQTSRILFLNDYSGSSSQQTANLHLELLSAVGLDQIDYLDISDGRVLGGTRVPLSNALPDRTLAEPTINLMLAQWDFIYWISDDLDRNIGYALELTADFFDQGGKMFINIPIEFVAERNPLFQFLPFQGVQDEPVSEYPRRSPTFQVQRCTEISATNEIDYSPYLRLNTTIQPAYPIIPFSESISLFNANLRLILRNPTEYGEYQGRETISTMNPEQSIFYFGFDLADFTTPNPLLTDPDFDDDNNPCETPESTDENPEYYPPSDLEGLVEFITIETLGFEQ